METLKLKQIADACGAAVSSEAGEIEITGISTDTRSIGKGNLFIPLIGEKFDGHDYIETAAQRGAAAALVSRDVAATIPVLKVSDTLEAMRHIAAYYRGLFDLPVIGITGSVGKTSTKEMIAAVLETGFDTLKTSGNQNNEIGVPHTLFNLENHHQAAVVEMGINHFGEMTRLTSMVHPTIAVVTCIGMNHIEFLGSREGIAKAKLEILSGLKAGGLLLLNGDEPLLGNVQKQNFTIETFGRNEDNDYYPLKEESNGKEQNVLIRTPKGTIALTIPVLGSHHVMNAMAAVAIGQYLGLTDEQIAAGVMNFQQTGRRQHMVQIAGRTIIDDSYNAAPDSILAGLSVLKQCEGGSKYAILGGMLELGQEAPKAHYDVGVKAADYCKKIYCYGANAEEYVKGANSVKEGCAQLYNSHEEIAKAVLNETSEGDVFLLKGSRGMTMEKVIDYLEKGSV